jgi:hypothetical protein
MSGASMVSSCKSAPQCLQPVALRGMSSDRHLCTRTWGVGEGRVETEGGYGRQGEDGRVRVCSGWCSCGVPGLRATLFQG